MRTRLASSRGFLTVSALLAATLAAGLSPRIGAAQTPPAARSAPVGGIAWAALSPAQKSVLAPLQRDWDQLEPARKTKWVEIADRFPRLSAAEQNRIKERMSTWARMTPVERARARQNYKEAQQLSPQERKARWEAYNALPADRRQELAQRNAPAASQAADKRRDASKPDHDRLTKSNIVPGAPAPRPKAVTPTVTQARPGATTNPISRRPAPPVHQQAGQPKIAASPGFVDETTLLPKRGPQGAAVYPASEQRSGKANRP